MIEEYNLLLHKNECEWLDFKQEYHVNNAEFVHDILCLSNAETDNDRYLVFGVSDEKAIVGICSNTNRKTQAQVLDLIKNSNFNTIPTIYLHPFVCDNGKEIDILEIKNKKEKPYFLLKDKKVNKFEVRAGVVYTRIGDTNIPCKETADVVKIENMWRERFGIDLSPLQRFQIFINDVSGWVREQQMTGNTAWYYEAFPEYVLEYKEMSPEKYDEKWTRKFPDQNAFRYLLRLKYNTTTIKEYIFVAVDGGRYIVASPERKAVCEDSEIVYFIVEGSDKYIITMLIATLESEYSNYCREVLDKSFFKRAGIMVFKSEKEQNEYFASL